MTTQSLPASISMMHKSLLQTAFDLEVKSVLRHVRTPAGVAHFKAPIGSVIIADSLMKKLKHINPVVHDYPNVPGGITVTDDKKREFHIIPVIRDAKPAWSVFTPSSASEPPKTVLRTGSLESALLGLDDHLSRKPVVKRPRINLPRTDDGLVDARPKDPDRQDTDTGVALLLRRHRQQTLDRRKVPARDDDAAVKVENVEINVPLVEAALAEHPELADTYRLHLDEYLANLVGYDPRSDRNTVNGHVADALMGTTDINKDNIDTFYQRFAYLVYFSQHSMGPDDERLSPETQKFLDKQQRQLTSYATIGPLNTMADDPDKYREDAKRAWDEVGPFTLNTVMARVGIARIIDEWAVGSTDSATSLMLQDYVHREIVPDSYVAHIENKSTNGGSSLWHQVMTAITEAAIPAYVASTYAHTQRELGDERQYRLYRGVSLSKAQAASLGFLFDPPTDDAMTDRLHGSMTRLANTYGGPDSFLGNIANNFFAEDLISEDIYDRFTEEIYANVGNVRVEQDLDDFPVDLQPLSSFSWNQTTAEGFTKGSSKEVSIVLSADVPKESIWSTAVTGSGCYNEGEAVIFGGKYSMKATVSYQHEPDFEEVQTVLEQFDGEFDMEAALTEAAKFNAKDELRQMDFVLSETDIKGEVPTPGSIGGIALDTAYRKYRDIYQKLELLYGSTVVPSIGPRSLDDVDADKRPIDERNIQGLSPDILDYYWHLREVGYTPEAVGYIARYLSSHAWAEEAKSLSPFNVETKGVLRHVRTPAGVAHFKQPIGSVIIADSLMKRLTHINRLVRDYPDVPGGITVTDKKKRRFHVLPNTAKGKSGWSVITPGGKTTPAKKVLTSDSLEGALLDLDKKLTVTKPNLKRKPKPKSKPTFKPSDPNSSTDRTISATIPRRTGKIRAVPDTKQTRIDSQSGIAKMFEKRRKESVNPKKIHHNYAGMHNDGSEQGIKASNVEMNIPLVEAALAEHPEIAEGRKREINKEYGFARTKAGKSNERLSNVSEILVGTREPNSDQLETMYARLAFLEQLDKRPGLITSLPKKDRDILELAGDDYAWRFGIEEMVTDTKFRPSTWNKRNEHAWAAVGPFTLNTCIAREGIDSVIEAWAGTSAKSKSSMMLQDYIAQRVTPEARTEHFIKPGGYISAQRRRELEVIVPAYAASTYEQTQKMLPEAKTVRLYRGMRFSKKEAKALGLPTGQQSKEEVFVRVITRLKQKAEGIGSSKNMSGMDRLIASHAVGLDEYDLIMGDARTILARRIVNGIYDPNDDDYIVRDIDDLPVDLQPLSSFSWDKTTAKDTFAEPGMGWVNHPGQMVDWDCRVGIVLTADVPRSMIFSTAVTGTGCFEESEVVVIGGHYSMSAQVRENPTNAFDYEGSADVVLRHPEIFNIDKALASKARDVIAKDKPTVRKTVQRRMKGTYAGWPQSRERTPVLKQYDWDIYEAYESYKTLIEKYGIIEPDDRSTYQANPRTKKVDESNTSKLKGDALGHYRYLRSCGISPTMAFAVVSGMQSRGMYKAADKKIATSKRKQAEWQSLMDGDSNGA